MEEIQYPVPIGKSPLRVQNTIQITVAEKVKCSAGASARILGVFCRLS